MSSMTRVVLIRSLVPCFDECLPSFKGIGHSAVEDNFRVTRRTSTLQTDLMTKGLCCFGTITHIPATKGTESCLVIRTKVNGYVNE